MPARSEGYCSPKTLPDFQQRFANEEACIAYLYSKRFPEGFVCHYCDQHEDDAGPPYTFAGRPSVYRCGNCKRDTSLTAGTIMVSVSTIGDVVFCKIFEGRTGARSASLLAARGRTSYEQVTGSGLSFCLFRVTGRLRDLAVRG